MFARFFCPIDLLVARRSSINSGLALVKFMWIYFNPFSQNLLSIGNASLLTWEWTLKSNYILKVFAQGRMCRIYLSYRLVFLVTNSITISSISSTSKKQFCLSSIDPSIEIISLDILPEKLCMIVDDTFTLTTVFLKLFVTSAIYLKFLGQTYLRHRGLHFSKYSLICLHDW